MSSIGEDFCGLDVNTPLGGEQPVSAVPVLLFNTRLTAVVATSTGDFTVVFIGTSTGHLKKVIILGNILDYFRFNNYVSKQISPAKLQTANEDYSIEFHKFI